MKDIKIIILLLFIISIPLFSCLQNNFVNWDDDCYVTKNPLIRTISTENIKEVFDFWNINKKSSFIKTLYTPLTLISFSLEYYYFKLNPFYYHLTNLILHLLNSLLVFWLIFLISKNKIISFFTALLFGIHPLHVESIAWISERKDLLYSFFFLFSIITYIYYIQKKNLFYYFISLFLFLLSLFSKPMGVTLPVILFLIDYFFNQKFDKKRIFEKIPFFILTGIFVFITYTIARNVGTPETDSIVNNYFHNFFFANYLILFYLKKLLLPVNLSVIYPPPQDKELLFIYIYSLITVLIFITFIIFSIKYTKKIFLGCIFAFITILPVIIRPVSSSMASDRYTYIASIGLFYIFSEGLLYLYQEKLKSSKIKYVPVILSAAVIIILSSLTMERCNVWNNSISLWTDNINKYPNFLAYHNRAGAYYYEEEYDKALMDYSESIKIFPKFKAYTNRGNIYIIKGEYSKAIDDFTKALEIDPAAKEPYNNRGSVYNRICDYNKAIDDFNKAIEIDSLYPEAYNNRAFSYFMKKDYKKAMEDVKKVKTLGYKVDPVFYDKLIDSIEKN